MCKKILSVLILIVFILFEFCGLYSYALSPYEGEVYDPQIENIEGNVITLVAIQGYEYSNDNGVNWQDSNVFNKLEPFTEYNFIQRVKETENCENSPNSNTINATTGQVLLDENIPEGWEAIWNEEELHNVYSSRQYILMNDIQIEDETYKYVICDSIEEEDTQEFKGIINGNGHTLKTKCPLLKNNRGIISNLNIIFNEFMNKDNSTSGLGGIVYFNYGKIIKCNISGSINCTTDLGGIAFANSSYGEILNCSNKAELKSTKSVAGMAYYNYADGLINNCYNEGNIESLRADFVGAGIAYKNQGSVYECYNLASFECNGNFCGIVAESSSSYGNVKKCYNLGSISTSEKARTSEGELVITECAGIVWENKNFAKIEDCYNSGTIIAGRSAGITVNNDTGDITNCYNKGKLITLSGDNANAELGKCAGIAITNYGDINKCFNSGELETTKIGRAGGISCENERNSTIANCYNSGRIISTAQIGGIAESNWGEITNSYNIGELFINSYFTYIYAGGISGTNGSLGTIDNCYNMGTINGNVINNEIYITQCIGGISGSNYYSKVSKCYNLGEIDLRNNEKVKYQYTGGITGKNQEKAMISNCYNVGKINSDIINNEFINNYYIGGIAGYNYEGKTNICYNIGVINSNIVNIGKIIGYNSKNSEEPYCCYYLDKNKEYNGIGTGISYLKMQEQESFEGFDLDTVWQINPNADYYFPTLRGMENDVVLPKNVETESITTDSITFRSIEGYEYSIDGDNYQDSNLFENLESSKEYTIYQRIKKTDTTEESIAAYITVKTLTLNGDVNGDGKVNITDVALINAHVKKTKLLTGEELERADINGDGKINITDVALVNAHVKKVKLLF